MLYMFVALLAPELFACCALMDCKRALALQLKVSKSLSVFSIFPLSDRYKVPAWSRKQCYFVRMGGIAVQCASDPEGKPTNVDPEQLVEVFESGILDWPTIHEPDIDDRSKADWIVKCIALMQIIWFTAQILGRAVQRLPVTTLELFTLGIVICTVVAYAAWWKKPFDIRKPLVIDVNAVVLASLTNKHRIKLFTGPHFPVEPFLDWRILHYVSVTLIFLAFGAIHLLGWNFYFPTVAERWLWRVASLLCIAVPMISLATATLMLWRTKWDPKGRVRQFVVAQSPMMVIYVLCRLYMFVDMFVGLRDVPYGVYKTAKWSQYFPSFD
jgi:hypothetical protein